MDGAPHIDVPFLWYDCITNIVAMVVILAANIYLFTMALQMRELFREFQLVKGYGGDLFLAFF